MRYWLLAFLITLSHLSSSQPWKAQWIAPAGAHPTEYGVYLFKRSVDLKEIPREYKVHVSADNRYRLFVNGTEVSEGPARSDPFHWNYETVDLAPHLRTGVNVVSATVWNEGAQRPEAQMSRRTAFILQGATPGAETLNTGPEWKAVRHPGYRPLTPELIYTYYVSGPGEEVDFRNRPAGAAPADTAFAAWPAVQPLFAGLPKGSFDWSEGWMLVPRDIPPMERGAERPLMEGMTLAPRSRHQVILDAGTLTNSYPVVRFRGGRGGSIKLTYAEALYERGADTANWRTWSRKGHRDSVAGRHLFGRSDRLLPDGSTQAWSPLQWRTFRFIKLEVESGDEPLELLSIHHSFAGYPFRLAATFSGGSPFLRSVLETGWRTARLCAAETYMDCPYYEQLQYIGDARIQALVSYYNSGDDRLAKRALRLMDASRMAEGITLSRYPTASPQQIPTFSLWYIGMLEDFFRYRPDPAFVRERLPGMRSVLSFFARYQDSSGGVRRLPYWNFTDWAEGAGWYRGVAPVDSTGRSAALDLQLLLAYASAARLERHLGLPALASLYEGEAARLKKRVQTLYWSGKRGLYADTPGGATFSQHVNTLALLAGLPGNEAGARAIGQKILKDTALTPATIYFRYYVNRALIGAGLGNEYQTWLDVYARHLQAGLTTWAEISNTEATRSDCHAWGSHPNIEVYRTMLGIDSDAPGFRRVVIRPHLGGLPRLEGSIPHPDGPLSVQYEQRPEGLSVRVKLPPGITGRLIWQGKEYPLLKGDSGFLLRFDPPK